MDRAGWLKERTKYLTASDVASLLGMNSSKSASAVVREKAGLGKGSLNIDDMTQVAAGRFLESGIAAWFLSDTPYTDAFANGDNLRVSPSIPYLAATPDWVVDGAPLEIKCSGETQVPNWFEKTTPRKGWPDGKLLPQPASTRVRWPLEFLQTRSDARDLRTEWRRSRAHQVQVLMGGMGEAIAPLKYWVQLQIQMHVMSADHGWICGLVGGTRRIDLAYERDDEFLAQAFEIVGNAWKRVQELKGT